MSLKGRKNIYTCKTCGGEIVTIDRDDHRVHRIDMEAEPIQKSGLGD